MRRIMTLMLLVILTLPVMARRAKDTTLSLRDSIIAEADKHIGKRYQYAGKGPKRFDCSGFTGYVFRQFGYELYASSSSQYLQGAKSSLADAKKGDLIFFKGSNAKSKSVGHVGIIYEVNPDGKNTTLRFIHASINKGITIDNYPESDYYRARFMGIRHIVGELNRNGVPYHEEEESKEEVKEQENEETTPQKEEEEKVVPEEKTEEETKRQEEPFDQRESHPVWKEDTIFHTVKKKETLFKISKKYKCTVEDLMEWNHLSDTYLKLGQTLFIIKVQEGKREEIAPTPHNERKEEPVSVNDTIKHTVQAKETLYRLSKQYGCEVDDIKEWNHLKDNSLKIGQTIIIIRSKEK